MGNFTNANGNNYVMGATAVPAAPNGIFEAVPQSNLLLGQPGQGAGLAHLGYAVYNGSMPFNWNYDLNDRPTPNISLGSTSHQLFATYGTPTGTTVTAKRVDWCTYLANGQATPAAIGNVVGPDATGGPRFSSQNSIFGSPPNLTTAWQVMDGQKADCGTLSTLMKYELDMLGATGSQVSFVLARHASWTGLSQAQPVILETDGSSNQLGIWFGGGSGHGWNIYEGCCVFQSLWWEGGCSQSAPSAYQVLMNVAGPNTSGADVSHQCWENNTPTAASFPPGTP
jgi:hypothetical protein